MFGQFHDSPVQETKETAPVETEKVEQTGESVEEPTQTESEAVEKVEAEATAETTTEDNDSDDDNGDDADDEKVEKPKKGFERRIERFNRRLSEKEQEIEYWKKAALNGNQGVVQPTAQPAAPTGKPQFSDFNDIETYTEALTDWKVQQAFGEVTKKQTVDKIVSTYDQRITEFKKTTPDFQEVIDDFVEDYGDKTVPEIVQVAMDSEVGPAIAYYLAKNTKEVDRIAALPPYRRWLELGKIEDRLSKPVEKAPVDETKKVSKAAPPIESVKGKGKVEVNDIYAEIPYEQWVKLRTKKK